MESLVAKKKIATPRDKGDTWVPSNIPIHSWTRVFVVGKALTDETFSKYRSSHTDPGTIRIKDTEEPTDLETRAEIGSWLSEEFSVFIQKRQRIGRFKDKLSDLFGRIPEVTILYMDNNGAAEFTVITVLSSIDKSVRSQLFDMEMTLYKLFPDYGIEFRVNFINNISEGYQIPENAETCISRLNA